MLFASMYEKPTGRISENTLSGRKNKIMNKVEKNKKKRHIHGIPSSYRSASGHSDKCSSVGCSVDQ